jgi:hypothetical protein
MSTLLKLYPNVFINNKYLKWYENLTSQSSSADYLEKHHIVPKSIIPNNIVVSLTARQHYIAHLLLIKCVNPIYRKKMLYAITAMKMRTAKGIKFNSRLFEKLKIEANINRSIALKGRTHTPEARAKIKARRALQVISDETKLKMSKARKGRKNSPEIIERVRQSHIGSKRSEETKQRMREERATRQPLTCVHCGVSCLPGNFHRWHNDNCKQRNQL